MANATAEAAKAAKAKVALSKLLRQKNNENSAKFFAAGIVAMIVLFMIFHWTRYVYKKYESKKGKPSALKAPISIARLARSILIRKVPCFTSTGHVLFFVGWFATCISIAFTNIDWSNLVGLSKRLGWVAISNLALVTFLGLKNTPLAILTSYSYERLNILHQLAGYGTVFWALTHATVYCTAWSRSHTLHDMLEETQIFGMVAGISLLIILATSLFLRSLRYEVFYIAHIIFFMLIIIMVGMHRPDFTQHAIIGTIVIGSAWTTDRLLRFAKISFFSFGKSATITPLPHGATRIVLRKSPKFAVAGSHAFLWIPSVRAAETHPFTIVSTKPLEFVVAAYDGFTRDLHAYALKNPGATLKASLDGPYGNVPNFTHFTKVVFIAGGSGASFTVGAALALVQKLGDSARTTIEFIWAVRDQEYLPWFTKELEELQASPLVNISIHCTRSAPITSQSSISSISGDDEKTPLPIDEATHSVIISQEHANLDIEKRTPSSTEKFSNSLELKSGRPDISSIVREIVSKADNRERIAVAACGPEDMMLVTRRTVANRIKVDGPSVELFLEQFGW